MPADLIGQFSVDKLVVFVGDTTPNGKRFEMGHISYDRIVRMLRETGEVKENETVMSLTFTASGLDYSVKPS